MKVCKSYQEKRWQMLQAQQMVQMTRYVPDAAVGAEDRMSDLSASAAARAAAFLAFCLCFFASLAATSDCRCSSSAEARSMLSCCSCRNLKLSIFRQAQQLHQAQ